jgi:hypothetical protein
VEGSGLWFDGVGGGGPGNTLPAEDVPGADATAAPVEEDEEEDAMERRRLAGAAEGFFWWETGGGLLGGVREQAGQFMGPIAEQAVGQWTGEAGRNKDIQKPLLGITEFCFVLFLSIIVLADYQKREK